MYLHITPFRTTADIQKEFNAQFPYLKLEFFQKNFFGKQGSSLKKPLRESRKVGEVQMMVTDAEVEIREDMKVKELEKIFGDQLGLDVQVYRRSGNLWLETTMTDNWTLRQQNEHGEEISTAGTKKNIFLQDDYDLRRDNDA